MSATSDLHYDALSDAHESESEYSQLHDARATPETGYNSVEGMPSYEVTQPTTTEVASAPDSRTLAYESQLEAEMAARNAEQQATAERKAAVVDIAHATRLLISYRDFEIAA